MKLHEGQRWMLIQTNQLLGCGFRPHSSSIIRSRSWQNDMFGFLTQRNSVLSAFINTLAAEGTLSVDKQFLKTQITKKG